MWWLMFIFILSPPIVLSGFIGNILSQRSYLPIAIVGALIASAYPLAHWYLLYYGFGVCSNPKVKDDIVGATALWIVMIAEMPICFTIYCIARTVGRQSLRRFKEY